MSVHNQFVAVVSRGALVLVLSVLGLALGGRAGCATEPANPLERAVNYLSAEVSKWNRENRCYSCHNNGDAVRALIAAHDRSWLRDISTLDDTLTFLRAPANWDANGPDGPFKDKKLARIQFAGALAAATKSHVIHDRRPLITAARLVTQLQQADGSWPADAPGTVGSSVTYGVPLATAVALRTLRSAEPAQFSKPIQRAYRWFEMREPRGVLEAAATLLALADRESSDGLHRREQALMLVKVGESTGGGWGPFVNSPPEPFDTAVVLIALHELGQQRANHVDYSVWLRRGKAYLLARQNLNGSWPATTRPPGVDSYAQQISTTSWALQALLLSAVGEE